VKPDWPVSRQAFSIPANADRPRRDISKYRPSRPSRAFRTEELEGFIAGLFGTADRLDLTERAHCRVQILGEVHGLFVAMRKLPVNEADPPTSADLTETVGTICSLLRYLYKKSMRTFCLVLAPAAKCWM
jgi:hypothetical protein